MIKTFPSASRLRFFAATVSVFALPLFAAPALAQPRQIGLRCSSEFGE